jgi:hypothetical protein
MDAVSSVEASWLHGAADVHARFRWNKYLACRGSRRGYFRNDARQGPPGHELLYVLGFGTAGAIFTLAAVLTCFELFRA